MKDKETSQQRARLFVVSGPSGVGKSTIMKRFLAEDGRSTFSVSYTTRNRRDSEVNGREYHFVDKATFEMMTTRDGFLEWENVHGYFYGTPSAPVFRALEKGIDVLLDIDVKGAIRVKDKCPQACLIFLAPPSKEELIQRLSLRGEKEIELRMKRVEEELSKKYLFQYVVINDKIAEAYEEFKGIIEAVRREGNGKDHS